MWNPLNLLKSPKHLSDLPEFYNLTYDPNKKYKLYYVMYGTYSTKPPVKKLISNLAVELQLGAIDTTKKGDTYYISLINDQPFLLPNIHKLILAIQMSCNRVEYEIYNELFLQDAIDEFDDDCCVQYSM